MEVFPNPYSEIYDYIFPPNRIIHDRPLNDIESKVLLQFIDILHFLEATKKTPTYHSSLHKKIISTQYTVDRLSKSSDRGVRLKGWFNFIKMACKNENKQVQRREIRSFRKNYVYPFLKKHSLVLIR